MHVEELARLTTLEARAYTDQAINAQANQGVITHEVLEKKALVGVQESKAYADSAVGGIAKSLGAVANALVELQGRVDQLSVGSAATAVTYPSDLKAKLGALNAHLEELQSQPADDRMQSQNSVAIEEARSTIGELNNQLGQLSMTLQRLDQQIAPLIAGKAAGGTDGSGATTS